MQDDPYRRVSNITIDEVAPRVHVPHEPPELILLIAPCRSGTSSHLRVFAAAGIRSYHQPLKALLRCLLQGQEGQYHLPQEQFLFIKETLGPYTPEESLLNPLDVLLRAGVPKEKIRLIIMLREPLSTLASWQEIFSVNRDPEVLLSNFILAYKTVSQIRKEAMHLGIPVTSYVYEALRDNNPSLVIASIFSRLAIRFASISIEGWQGLSPYGTPESNITTPSEPMIYILRNLRDQEEGASRLQFYPKATESIDRFVATQDIALLINGGITEMYEKNRKACEDDLQVVVRKSQEISEYNRRHNINP